MKYLKFVIAILFVTFGTVEAALPYKDTLQTQTAAKQSRTRLEKLMSKKISFEEFRKRFLDALIDVCNSTGPFHESEAFPIVEKIAKYIRENNIYAPMELRELLGVEQTKQYDLYYHVVHEYRRLRTHQDSKRFRLRNLAQQNTNMLNYTIAANIVNYHNLNIQEAKVNFERLHSIIPSDPWVEKYYQLLQ